MRSVLHRLEAASIGVILALILAELGLRAFRLAPTGGIVSVTSEQYRRIPGIFAPNQRALDQRKPELAFWVTIDSLGYRGADFPRVKPRGEFRVFVAGDSFVYGDFVEDAETFPAWLARFLSSRCENVRVINGGLGGATIVDESPMIDRATALDLDLILLVFTENDVTDLAGTPMWARLAENRRAKSRFPLSVAYPLLRRTALWNFGLQV